MALQLARPLSAAAAPAHAASRPQTRRVASRAAEADVAVAEPAADAAPAASPSLVESYKVTSASVPRPRVPGFAERLSFKEGLPERLNGRLAMLGFLAAFHSELNGMGLAEQMAVATPFVLSASVITVWGSMAPVDEGSMPETAAAGPFTADAELMNGRAAMVGFSLLCLIEAFTGKPFF